jgi:hypothetical protein
MGYGYTEHPQLLPTYLTEGEFSLYHCLFIRYKFITVELIYNRFVLIIQLLPTYPTEELIYNWGNLHSSTVESDKVKKGVGHKMGR